VPSDLDADDSRTVVAGDGGVLSTDIAKDAEDATCEDARSGVTGASCEGSGVEDDETGDD